LETLDIIFDILWEAGSGLESFVEKYDGNEEEYVDHGNRQADIWHLLARFALTHGVLQVDEPGPVQDQGGHGEDKVEGEVGAALVLAAVHEDEVADQEGEAEHDVNISLYFQWALLSLSEDVGVADDPEEGEEGETASQDCAVELHTPDTGRHGGTS